MAFGSEQWMYSAGGFYPDEIGQSLRFDDSYLSRTPSVAGNRKTWTWSGWVKRSSLVFHELFGAYTNNNNQLIIRMPTDGGLRVFQDVGGSKVFDLTTNAVYRDASAWYHITVALDTTESTSSDRLKLYVNGEQVTSFSTANYPALNANYEVNSLADHYIGQRGNGSGFLNGYLAEVNFVDGQALDPTDFGEFKSGVWIPKRYSGTYGTNGFYLDFGNSGSLGADVSGNGNNWTPTNLASTDQMPDSPTNNWATLNPLWSTLGTLSEGNLKNTTPGSGRGTRASTFCASSGKYYCEVLYTDVNPSLIANARIGVIRSDSPYSETDSFTSSGYDGIGYVSTGDVVSNGSTTNSGGAAYTDGDIVGVALDMDAGQVSFYKNGTLQYSAINPSSILNSGSWMFVCADSSNSNAAVLYSNFGQDSSFAGTKTAQGNTDANGIGDFYYAPPADHLALCSANLPETAIDPNRDDIPADYFNPALYTGNGSTQSITGVGFRPDWVWTKGRSNSRIHSLLDVVRGANKYLSTNDDLAEVTPANNNRITTIDADGFSLGNSTNVNASSETYVAWNWKAGGTAVANTDGTLASQVSANTKAGFSIVSYTGNGTEYPTVATVGHGLNQDPEMIIVKDRDTASTNWCVYNQTLALDQALLLNDAGVAQSFSNAFGRADPTSTVFTVGQATGGSRTNDTGTYIAYCFHSVEGFSKFGSYTGNGSTDGPFVYTGFRPAYVMIKKTSGTGNWLVYDNKRGAYNLNGSYLYANTASVESTSSTVGYDFLSNGFKTRNTYNDGNVSGETYIYMAFAEMPFKYANAR